MVARTSRGSAFSSASAPASAGMSPGGGSYSGLTDRVATGSRPYAHQTSQPKPRATSGSAKGQLSLTNQTACWRADGRPTWPGGQPTTTVMPSRGLRGRVAAMRR